MKNIYYALQEKNAPEYFIVRFYPDGRPIRTKDLNEAGIFAAIELLATVIDLTPYNTIKIKRKTEIVKDLQ